MSSTNHFSQSELKAIVDAANEIHDNIGQYKKIIGVVSYISDYGFESPRELIEQLEKFWDRIEKPYMKQFVRPIVAGVFKHKGVMDEQAVEILPYIYEF